MVKKISIALCGLILVVLSTALYLSWPKWNGVVLRSQNLREAHVSLPFSVEAPTGEFSVLASLELSVLSPSIFVIQPDDCVDEILINGIRVNSRQLPYCDHKFPLIIDLNRHLHRGLNSVEFRLRNLGWPVGLSIQPFVFDPTYVLFFLFFWIFCHRLPRSMVGSCKSRIQEWTMRRRTFSISVWQLIVFPSLSLVVLFLALAFIFLVWQVRFDLLGLRTADTPLYWYGGRALLAGLVPYIDFFETKPPGIFVVSAISYYLFDSPLLTRVIAFLSPIVIALSPFLVGIDSDSRSKEKIGRIFPINSSQHLSSCLGYLALFALAINISLFSWYRSGGVQIEIIGSAFVILYCATFCRIRNDKISTCQYFLLSLFMFLSVGLKEPFILVIFACALLLSSSIRDLILKFCVPMLVVSIFGFFLMVLFGYWEGYRHLYLVEIFGRHIDSSSKAIGRLFEMRNLFREIYISNLWISFLVLATFSFVSIFQSTTLIKFAFAILKLAISLILVNLVVALGGQFYNHHYVFAAPFLFVFARYLFLSLPGPVSRSICILIFLIGLSPIFITGGIDFSSEVEANIKEDFELIQSAKVVDEIMDSCQIDNYLHIGGNGPSVFLYTKHLPSGPFFFQYNYFLGRDREDFRMAFEEQIREAKLVIVKSNAIAILPEFYRSMINSRFSGFRPECASESIEKLGMVSLRFENMAND